MWSYVSMSIAKLLSRISLRQNTHHLPVYKAIDIRMSERIYTNSLRTLCIHIFTSLTYCTNTGRRWFQIYKLYISNFWSNAKISLKSNGWHHSCINTCPLSWHCFGSTIYGLISENESPVLMLRLSDLLACVKSTEFSLIMTCEH